MTDYVLHDRTKEQLERFAHRTPHAVLLIGPKGIGKGTVATLLAEQTLGISSGHLDQYPHVKRLSSADRKAIGIDAVRELEHFMSLKIPGNKTVARIAIIEDAHMLTVEAQNALLKTLEEPPTDAVIILTAAQEQALLPTIRSRSQTIDIKRPTVAALKQYFSAHGEGTGLDQALAISNGLPGLMTVLLDETTEHPLLAAAQLARKLLQQTVYERLLSVDELVKDKQLALDVCYVLGQMASLSVSKSSSVKRWRQIMQAAYSAEEGLLTSAQPKLALTNLMLQL